MKRLLLFAILAFALPAYNGCQTAPSQRSEAVTTLKVLGASVDASMRVAAQLRHDGRLTAEQWQRVAEFFDNKWKPVYLLAVVGVQSDLTLASPDLIQLAAQLAALISSFTAPTP